ncbi:MAG: hypothetical protein M1820_003927 [Bogoriella megaspora]|nr:MAG: hypothetical protein M1820_003927 [Bogoriella megaspora]
MATFAHCAYCFETLSASLENRKSLSLAEVEILWDKFVSPPNEDEDVEDSGPAGAQIEDEDTEMDTDDRLARTEFAKPAAISRLLDPSPSSSTTPSVRSSNSSRADGSSNSKASSRTSIFSFGRKQDSRGSSSRTSTQTFPLFVTWNTINRNGNQALRGCIGTFEAQELDQGLSSYALTSAFEDHRFMPITIRELPTLECGITLLTNFEPISDPMSWEIGKHGLRISFTYHSRRYGSTYLPSVAKEQGWTKEETMISLMRKAGWTGRKDDWRKVQDLHVVRYQGYLEELGYREWRAWRDWIDEQ